MNISTHISVSNLKVHVVSQDEVWHISSKLTIVKEDLENKNKKFVIDKINTDIFPTQNV